MPITPQYYNDDAIKGEQLSKLMENEIRDRLKGEVPETLAHAMCVMASEIDALKAALAAQNLGDLTADSLDAQDLKKGGNDVLSIGDTVTDSQYAGKIGSSSSHPQIGSESVPVYVDSNGNLQPCSGVSGCFFATYGTTTFAKVKEAFDEGFLVFTMYSGNIYVIYNCDNTNAKFIRTTTHDKKTFQVTVTVNSNNTWSSSFENIFDNVLVRKNYSPNHEATATITAADLSNGYIDVNMDFMDMYYGSGYGMVFIGLPNETYLTHWFTRIEVLTYPYNSSATPFTMCKFNDLTHDDYGDAITSNDEYTWNRTCNETSRFQRIKGVVARCYFNPNGQSWSTGDEIKLRMSINAISYSNLGLY